MIRSSRISSLTLIAVLFTCAFTSAVSALIAPSVTLAANTISGLVFRDFNANGIKDTNESGIGAVTVTAYDGNNGVSGTTTTIANGTYTLNASGTGPYRIEFSGWPSYLQPGPIGTNAGGTVQFVAGTAANINLGLANPADFCGNNPKVVVSCFPKGNTTDAGTATNPVIYDYDYVANGDSSTVTKGTEALAQTTGTTYGIAYQRTFKRLFASAYVRRGAGLGSADSTGAIYVVDNRDPTTAQLFLNVNSVAGINTGTNPHPRVAGYNWTVDTAAYPAVGTVGIGDMDLSDDGNTLYAVNLNQKTLIIMPLGPGATAPAPAVITAVAIPVPSDCPTQDFRPFGLEYHDDSLYVGAVCSAQSTNNAANLRAYVLRFNPSSTGPGAQTFTDTTTSQTLNFQLNYPRTYINNGNVGPNGDGEWNPWSDTWTAGGLQVHPQPMLSDIEFDDQGFMMLGFRDRFGDQAYDSGDPGPTNGTLTSTRAGGDLLLACKPGATWQLESAGACGTRTTNDPNSGAGGSNFGSGPGNREFYYQESYNPFHSETGVGSLAMLPGSGEVLSTVYDTFNTFENGVTAFTNATGARNRAVQVYAPTDTTRYGKSNGLGDIELLCDLAPIEVGNRVWRDTNGNGIQDAGELGIANTVIGLYNASGTLIDTVTTDSTGTYLFSSAAGTDAVGRNYGVNIAPNIAYTVAILSSNLATGGVLAGYQPTTANASGNTSNQEANGTTPDLTDSDGVTVAVGTGANSATLGVAFTTGASGFNNHSFDFGVISPVSIGNQVWFDVNNNGSIDAGEAGVDGVVVDLFLDVDNSGTLTGAEQTAIATQTTTNGGYYLFTRDSTGVMLNPGTYQVGIRASNFASGSALAGSRSSGTSISNAGAVTEATIAANGTTDSNVDNADDGLTQTVGFYLGGVLSGSLVVTTNGEPASEATFGQAAGSTPGHFNTIDGTAGGIAIPDRNSNLTVDFGFYRQTLGDQIFHDANNNGTYDAGDAALVGATVQLYAANGTTEILIGPDGILGTADDAAGGIITTAAGTYLFQNLPQGQYIVKVTPPAGYTSSTDLASSANPNGNVNNDDNGIGSAQGQVSSSAITLTPGSTGTLNNNTVTAATGTTDNPTLDFGFYTLSIGNLVWNDTNNNGVLDGLETGINGVTVNLYRDTNGSGTLNVGDTLVGVPQVTSNSGHYLFTGLPPGTYFVQLAPSNFQAGGALIGYQSSTGANGQATGPYEPGKAGAVDDDDNGTTGTGGLATNGVTGGIVSGAIVLVAGTQPTGETDLGTPTGVTNTATDANSNLSIDFGVYRSAALGDFVWIDTNKNGVQDGGEIGVNGVRVSLFTPNGADGIAGTPDDTLPIATTTTATNGPTTGYYHFANLVPNTTYTIALDRASDFAAGGSLAGYTLTSQDQGGNDALDSDATLVNGVPTITATTGGPGTDILTYDFGFNTSASLGDYVWLDANNNGVQDATETGINGVTVSVYTANGADGIPGNADDTLPVATTITTNNGVNNGYYHFSNLLPNTIYVVRLDNPADFTGAGPLANAQLSPANQGGNAAKDSNAALVGSVPTIANALTGGPGTDTPTYDVGFYRPSASLGDYVWNDANKNGVQDGGETGINGVTVNLYDSTGTTLIDTKITTTNNGALGYYHFDNLIPNTTYVVKLNNPTDYTPAGPLASFVLTASNQGGDPARDSDATLVSGYPTIGNATTGVDGSDTRTYDIGLYQPLSIGNLVWNDVNNNGVVDAGEPGVNGITVNLYQDTDGSGTLSAGDTLTASQTTSNGGHYFFGDLGQGNYLVQLDAANFQAGGVLAGYASSVGAYAATGPYEPGVTTIADNDDNGTNLAQGGIVSYVIALAPGTQPTSEQDGALPTGATNTSRDDNSNLTLDFGVFRPARLGSLVWNDQNNDGVHQPSEPGMPNVTVTLYNATNTPVATTITDANGAYEFINLPPGTYTVGFTNLPSGFVFTIPKQGDDATDSDVNVGTGRTIALTVVPGDAMLTIFAGLTSNPTAITLTRFTATRNANGVAVNWTTSAEVNTFGFRLYRSATGQRADVVEVTTALIVAQGRGQGGASYTWTDTTAQTGVGYTYWLEETEINGTTHSYGPAILAATTSQRAISTTRMFLPLMTR